MGVIGGAITEAAAKNGMDVFVCSRRPLFGKYFNLKVKGIQGDWRDDCVAKCIVADNFDVKVTANNYLIEYQKILANS